jgi:hypothetical protein
MKKFRILLFFSAFLPTILITGSKADSTELSSLVQKAVNRAATVFDDKNRSSLRLSEGPGQGFVWIPESSFKTGAIELDVRGKDLFQKSFLGIAFCGIDDHRYEVVYLRPFNFRAEDPIRRSHAIQYAVHPDFPWDKLRKEYPGEFEKGVPGSPDPNGWVHLRVEVIQDRIRAFVNNEKSPSLDVKRLGNIVEGRVGFWVGEGSGGDFANLQIEPDQKEAVNPVKR